MRSLASALLLTAALTLAACGNSPQDDFGSIGTPPPTGVGATPAASTPDAAASTPATTTDSTTENASAKQGTCATVAQPSAKSQKVAKPTGKLSTSKKNLVTMKTSCGTIVIQLDPKAHPITANAFAWLAKKKYFDGTPFHRVVPGFVVQGGDPTGTGTGGPSWSLTEAPGANATYPPGTVAMAKTTDDPSGTIGSQFFIMTGGGLDPSYAIAGKVTSGMDAVSAMEKLSSGTDGPPTKPIVISKATFTAK